MSTSAMLFAAASSASPSLAPTPSSSGNYTHDPILEYRPSFALSMPVQVLLIGVVITLMSVLLGHLLFTAQYHWPLAPTNFALQLAGVVTLLVSQIATMHVVFSSALSSTNDWPYRFEYAAIDLPPYFYVRTKEEKAAAWSLASVAAWSLMNATTAGIIQITHIQFLTLLYPSRLERYLILAILAPLALTSAAMELIPIKADDHLHDIADVVNNVCDATLSLLFTAALLFWGLLVNRHEAWRFDGGTAAFGAGACILALISTALTFVYIPRRDQNGWLPSLILAIILWQSFLGWWWWVGAAGAGAPGEDLVRKQEKRRRRREVRNAKRRARTDAAREWWRGFTSNFPGGQVPGVPPSAAAALSDDDGTNLSHTTSRQDGSTLSSSPRGRRRRVPGDAASSTACPSSSSGSAGSTTATSAPSTNYHYLAGRPAYIRWFHVLRQAHRHAIRRQAAEHNERIAQAYGPAAAEGERPIGWGLGSYGARELAARREEADAMHRSSGEYIALEERDGNGQMERDRGRDEEDVRSHTGAGPTVTATPDGVWWWGPLRRWRLQDSTSYS